MFSLISKKDYLEERDAFVCISDGFKDFSAELYNYLIFCTQTKYSFVFQVFYLVFEVVSHVDLVGLKLTVWQRIALNFCSSQVLELQPCASFV